MWSDFLSAWVKFLRGLGLVSARDHDAALNAFSARILKIRQETEDRVRYERGVELRALTRAKERHSDQFRKIKDVAGVTLKFGGNIDIDYDKLCNGLGLDQCVELRTVINSHLKTWRRKDLSDG